jgi:hypothetical protein
MMRRGLAVVFAGVACLVTRSDRAFPAPPDSAAHGVARPASPTTPDPSLGVVYVCPMDPDVRAHEEATCRRCGMALVAGIPDPVEFPLDLQVIPPVPSPGRPAVLEFVVRDPWKNRPVPTFNLVHEKLFHAFVVSEDLRYFQHGHPALVADGLFQYALKLPTSGMYRVLSDFYPAGAMPQLTTSTFIVPGPAPKPAEFRRDDSPRAGVNIHVALETIPGQPTAGNRTQMRFTIDAPRGLQQYLGAWGHMLVASDDLIDMMHEHPFRSDGPQVEFEVSFPRARSYRVWVQFQSDQVVNTVHFDLPVVLADAVSGP